MDKLNFHDLFGDESFGGGGKRSKSRSRRKRGPSSREAIDRKMNSDNSTTANSDVSGWDDLDVRLHAAGNIGLRGDNYGHSVGGCTGCHQGSYDIIGGRGNPTYNGQGQ